MRKFLFSIAGAALLLGSVSFASSNAMVQMPEPVTQPACADDDCYENCLRAGKGTRYCEQKCFGG